MQKDHIQYGILQELSDYRVHVCPKVRKVYWYKTSDMLELLNKADTPYKLKGVGKPPYTATGYPIPITDIPGLRTYSQLPEKWWDKQDFQMTDSTSDKGAKAEWIVKGCILKGFVPVFEYKCVMVTDKTQQLAGIDIQAGCKMNIQVKCDFSGGRNDDTKVGTGNLFVQMTETNKQHQH